jgi:hypothetical protein
MMTNVVLLFACLLVPLYAGSIRKKVVIDWTWSGLGWGGWSE